MILYKYISWVNDNHKKILTQQEMWLASISSFNDPFDACVPLLAKGTPKQIQKRINECLKEDCPNLKNKERKTLAIKLFREKHFENYSLQKDIHDDSRKNEYGAFCLSENKDNVLMWSHYADSHKGLCIGFDQEKLFTNIYEKSNVTLALKKVIYCSDFPKLYISIKPHKNKLEEDNLKDLEKYIQHLYIKSDSWNYENEWRLISFEKNNYSVNYSLDLIKELYFGLCMESQHKEVIIKFLKENNLKIDLYECYQVERTFRIGFKELKY